jgi:hypothetical protein
LRAVAVMSDMVRVLYYRIGKFFTLVTTLLS